MKKLIISLTVVLVSIVMAVAIVWNGEIRTISSIHQVGNDPYLYECDYSAPYDLDAVVESGIDENAKLVAFVISKLSRGLYNPKPKSDEKSPFACTSFQARNSETGGWIFGRNYDYFKNPSLVLHSHPKNGYASLSTVDLSHLGYNLDKLPNSLARKALCLASVYAPMDGINERGLCISIMALPKQAAYQNTGKDVVGTSIYMRLILDRCATVEEAIALTESLDIRHDQKAGSGYHYFIADAEGHAVVVEFDLKDGWKTMLVSKPEDAEYMHVTNHLLSPKYFTTEPNPEYGNPNSHSWERYAKVAEYMENHSGAITLDEAQECLSDVHWKDLVWPNGTIEDTQWSNVYDQNKLTLRLRDWYDYDTTVDFAL